MRIGIMGGTFDPIHIGHVRAAERAMEELALDRIWFVPAGVPIGKQPVAAPTQRLHMVCLAIKHTPYWMACADECVRNTPSYAIESLLRWSAQYPGVAWFWIVGADQYVRLDTWHRIEELLRLCTFVVVDRAIAHRAAHHLHAHVVSMPQIDVSSSDVRARYAAHLTVRDMVADEVDCYVRTSTLYGAR